MLDLKNLAVVAMTVAATAQARNIERTITVTQSDLCPFKASANNNLAVYYVRQPRGIQIEIILKRNFSGPR